MRPFSVILFVSVTLFSFITGQDGPTIDGPTTEDDGLGMLLLYLSLKL